MKRLAVLAAVLAIGAAACGKSSNEPSNPTPVKPTFTAALSTQNEVPVITGAEAAGSGTATITFEVTKDAAGNITAGTVTFQVSLTGFPPGTPFNIAHIHQAAAGTNGSVVINTSLAAGEVTASAAGTATITKSGIAADPALLQQIINNPAGFYFNVHSTLNPGGVARGQLVKTAG
jgi:hypothetical protein